MTTILDPTDEREPVTRQLTPRSGRRSAGTVALLDIAKPRGSVLLDRLEARLSERLPGIHVQRYAKADLHQAGTRCVAARRSPATMTSSWKRWLTEAPVPRAVCMTRYGSRFRERPRYPLRAANSGRRLRCRRMRLV